MGARRALRSQPQIEMPGMPRPVNRLASLGRHGIRSGQEVLYLGRVAGGPRYGSMGVVKQALDRTALIDIGASDLWHIPYYFLATPKERTR